MTTGSGSGTVTPRAISLVLSVALALDLLGTSALAMAATLTPASRLAPLAGIAVVGLGFAVLAVSMANATLVRQAPSPRVLRAAVASASLGFAVNTIGTLLVLGLVPDAPTGAALGLLLVGDALGLAYVVAPTLWLARSAPDPADAARGQRDVHPPSIV